MRYIETQYIPKYGSNSLWGTVVCISIVFHMAVFAAGLFFPDSWNSSSSRRPAIYNVNLVEMPSGNQKKAHPAVPPSGTAAKSAIIEPKPAERVSIPPASQKTKTSSESLVVAKKLVEKPEIKKESLKESPSNNLDKAIAKLEKNVKKQEPPDHLTKAISNIQKQIGNNQQSQDHLSKSIAKLEQTASVGSEEKNSGSGTSITLGEHLYALQVEEKIKSYWSYPFEKAGLNPYLEALVIVRVSIDGSVLALSLSKSSGDRYFDESVISAVERAKPLPPLPVGYNKTVEELELNFNLKDIERL